jgi:hypothetical protein
LQSPTAGRFSQKQLGADKSRAQPNQLVGPLGGVVRVSGLSMFVVRANSFFERHITIYGMMKLDNLRELQPYNLALKGPLDTSMLAILPAPKSC